MVVDTLENLEKYASLNPLFAQAIDFLKSHDLQAMEIGKTELKGKDLFVNIAQTKPKTKGSSQGSFFMRLSVFSIKLMIKNSMKKTNDEPLSQVAVQ